MRQTFDFQELDLKGAYRIRPFYAADERGGLLKDYNVDAFKAAGLSHDLREVFYSISKKGVMRGMHFQLIRPQPKLVRCVTGHIFDVIVDLRPDSLTFKQWRGYHLSEENMDELLIPAGFGHGYLVLSDSVVSYKCAEVFYDKGDSGIRYDDPDIGIRWPFELIGGRDHLIISEKDRHLMSFIEHENAGGLNEFRLKLL